MTQSYERLLKRAKQAPANTRKWPVLPHVFDEAEYEVVFKPYGQQGRGFYVVKRDCTCDKPQLRCSIHDTCFEEEEL